MRRIFVFGSNLSGVHGAGAAKVAADRYGALHRLGVGVAGNSYAIPTKDCSIQTLPLLVIKQYIDQFLDYAMECLNRPIEFEVTRIGCGLAGYTDEEIAPLFEQAPSNCEFDSAWKPWLPDAKFWGTY